MTLKPTDLRSSPFEISSMIDLAKYELNTKKIDYYLKLKQNIQHSQTQSEFFSKQLYEIVDNENDRVLFIEMLNLLYYLRKNTEEFGNCFFNSVMSFDLKEKFSSSSKVKIPYLTYLFAFKFNFLHVDWMKTFTKIADLIKIINTYLLELINKEEKISNILHILIVPLNIYEKNKGLQNSYSLSIGINDLSNDLIVFLENFRDLQFNRLKIPETSKPEITPLTFPIILLSYMQTMRKFLYKSSENPHYKEIKSLIIKEIEFLLNEKQETQKKLLELRLKLPNYEKCQVFLIDISDINDKYFLNFENRKILLISVFNHVGSLLFKNLKNMSFCCHCFKGILLICFQYDVEKKDSMTDLKEFSTKFRLILDELYDILSRKSDYSSLFFPNNEPKSPEIQTKISENTQRLSKSLKQTSLSLSFFDLSQSNVMEKYKENVLSESFGQEIWVEKVCSLTKRMGFKLPLANSSIFVPALEMLNRIERIKFLQNEIFNNQLIFYYNELFNQKIETIGISEEFGLFFYRIFGYLLRKKERLVDFLKHFPEKFLKETIFKEIFNDFSSDFFNLTELMKILLQNTIEDLIEEFKEKNFLFKNNLLLNFMASYCNSHYLRTFLYENYIVLIENSFQERELENYLKKDNSLDMIFIRTVCSIIFDVDSLKFMDFELKSLLFLVYQLSKDIFTEDMNINKFLTLFFTHFWVYSYYLERSFLVSNEFSSKGLKILKVFDKMLFSPFIWNDSLDIYIENFFEFLKVDLEKQKEDDDFFWGYFKKSEFLQCNILLIRATSLLNFVLLLKNLKEKKSSELSNELIFLQDFLWNYPKIEQLELFLKENSGFFIYLDFNGFLNENNVFPLNFYNEKQQPLSTIENSEIFAFLNDVDAKNFLVETSKINPKTKINNIEIRQMLELKKGGSKIRNKKKVDDFILNSSKRPEQKILLKNPYGPLTKYINFLKIDKRTYKIKSLIETVNIFLSKGKISRDGKEIERFLANSHKNFEELIIYKKLCESTELDIFTLEKIYEKFR